MRRANQLFARILLHKRLRSSPFTYTMWSSNLRAIRAKQVKRRVKREKRRKRRIRINRCKHTWKYLDSGRVHKARHQVAHQWFKCSICNRKQRRNIVKKTVMHINHIY